MYRIGIVDDVKSERDDIEVSILDNIGDEILFKEYELKCKTKIDLFKEIQDDVLEKEIQALIVDFKLDTTVDVIKGWEVIEFMHSECPEFPVVIMTNAPDESKESKYTDADKVYAKKVFLNPELSETKELVNNIKLNMLRYVTIRNELEEKLAIELQNLESDRENTKTIEKIVQIENELQKYKQIYQPTFDSTFKIDDLKEAFELLNKYEDFLEK